MEPSLHCIPAQPASLPAAGAARAHVCPAQQPGDSSGTCLPLSPPWWHSKHTGKYCHPGAGTGTYLTGSCMACSHDQQWEKRWNMVCSPARRGGLSAAPTTGAAQRVPVLHPPLGCLFTAGSISSGVPCPMAQHCCLQPGVHKPSLEKNPSWAMPHGHRPCSQCPSHQGCHSASHLLIPSAHMPSA